MVLLFGALLMKCIPNQYIFYKRKLSELWLSSPLLPRPHQSSLDLNILELHDLFNFKLLIFVYDSVNKISPACFHNFFETLSSVHQYNTRQASKGDIFMTQENTFLYGLRYIKYAGAKAWNDIPI